MSICLHCHQPIRENEAYKTKTCNHTFCRQCVESGPKAKIFCLACQMIVKKDDYQKIIVTSISAPTNNRSSPSILGVYRCLCCKQKIETQKAYKTRTCNHLFCTICVESRQKPSTFCLGCPMIIRKDDYQKISLPSHCYHSPNTSSSQALLENVKCLACEKEIQKKNAYKAKPCDHVFCVSCVNSKSGRRTQCLFCNMIVKYHQYESIHINPNDPCVIEEEDSVTNTILPRCLYCKQDIVQNYAYRTKNCQHEFCRTCVESNPGRRKFCLCCDRITPSNEYQFIEVACIYSSLNANCKILSSYATDVRCLYCKRDITEREAYRTKVCRHEFCIACVDSRPERRKFCLCCDRNVNDEYEPIPVLHSGHSFSNSGTE